MNFRKLLTYLTVGTAAVIPFAGAQNPTILQGSYISNVFGNSNFVKNPNAQTNVANVTNATRSTTTPLVATSEFNLSLDAGQNATWTLRTFDAGMKGQNCEARFSYRGFATATTTAEIVQNSLVVAQLVLTPSTDPRIASINFPCGDLANATTFRIAQTTANMTGTNEIGGVYTGLATNMANVAQAEFVGSVNFGLNCDFSRTSNIYGAPTDASCTTTPKGSVTAVSGVKSGVTISNAKPGVYRIVFNASVYSPSSTNSCLTQITDGTTTQRLQIFRSNASQIWMPASLEHTFEYTSTGSRTIEFQLSSFDNASICSFENGGGGESAISVYRFPTSSELVVTPERQNTFAGLRGTAAGASTNSVTAAVFTKLTSGSTLTRTLFGKADTTATNDYSLTINNMPVGTFLVSFTGSFHAQSSVAGNATTCTFAISDSVGGTNIAATIQYSNGDASIGNQLIVASGGSGLYTNNSVANKTFTIQASRLAGNGSCFGYADTNIPLTISVTPLDQPSNSALYVQGPVLGAATGAAIPAGYVGETIEASGSVNRTSGTATNFADVTGMSVTVTPGIWLICAYGTSYFYNAGSGFVGFENRIYNSTDATQFAIQSQRGTGYMTDDSVSFTMCKMFKATASKTFVTQTKVTIAAGVYTYGSQYAEGTISAIRLN